MYVSELLPISNEVELRGQILDEYLADFERRREDEIRAWEVRRVFA
jgi:hypothetical protein